MTTINRKRRRSISSDNNYTQSKYFINQQMVDLNDENKMKEIHKKTIDLLFEAANKIHDNNSKSDEEKLNVLKSIKLNGSGKFSVIGLKPCNLPETPDRTCICCTKNAIIHIECTNCNLELCENCGYSCDMCNEFVCHTCVNLFNCGTMENPCCQRCKIYLK